MKTATEQSYHNTIVVNSSIEEVFEKISNVSAWWAQNFEGSAKNLGDIFTIRFGETSVTFKLSEVIPGKKVAWHVIDCHLPWLSNKTEWTGTTVVFEASEKNNAVEVEMTHLGLVPAAECYADCEQGWGHYIKGSLFKFITEGEGTPSLGGRRQEQ